MNTKKPAYIHLYETLKEHIQNDVFSYQSKLPSKRVLADQYNLSLVTVEHALDILYSEGYIEPIERRGYFVSYTKLHPISSSLQQPITTPMTPISDTVFPQALFAKTVRHVLNEYPEEIMQRIPFNGCEILRAAIASYLARTRNIHVDIDQVYIGAGSEYLYSILIEFLGHDQIYAIEDPSFEKISETYDRNAIQYEKLKMGNDGILTSALNASKANVLHVTPYHSYPSGLTASASKKEEYVAWAVQHDAYIIEDDYDSEFTRLYKPVETLFAKEDQKHIFYMNTFTKSIGPSLRVSYLLIPKTLTKAFHQRIQSHSCTVSALTQYVIATLLNQGSFERHINRVRRKIRKSED